MAKRTDILAGATDQSVDVFIQDAASTTGAGLTGLAYNTASLTCYYRKGATGTATALTLAPQTVGGAHTDGGFAEIDATNMPGLYRLDLSDAPVASAGMAVVMLKGAAGMAPCVLELEIQPATGKTVNATHLGGTAWAETGLAPIRSFTAQAGGASSITLDAGASSTNDFYNGLTVVTVAGTGAGQVNPIATAAGSYNGTTKVATVVNAWLVVPDATTKAVLVPSADTAYDIADAIIGRNVAGGSNGGRTVGQSLARLRNRVVLSGGVLTVYDVDDSTSLWTGAVTTAAGNPVTEVNPT